MMFFEIDDGSVTLQDIKRITQHLLDNKIVRNQLTQQQHDDLKYMLTPTLASDQNEVKIRERWNEIVANLELKGDVGQPLRFYQDDKLQRLYFGDEEGWKEAQDFAKRESDPSLLKKHQGL